MALWRNDKQNTAQFDVHHGGQTVNDEAMN